MSQQHNYSLTSRGQDEVPTYSEALIQLNGDDSRPDVSAHSQQNVGASPQNSSQEHEGSPNGDLSLNADRQSPSTGQDELHELRTKEAVNAKIIKMLKQELNVKDFQIEQINDKRKHDDEVMDKITTQIAELKNAFKSNKNSESEKLLEDLKHQCENVRAHCTEMMKLLVGELKVKDDQIQQLNNMHKKTIEELTAEMTKAREAYGKQIKNLAVMMASITEENRRENEEAIEMLSNQMAEVMHLLENKQ